MRLALHARVLVDRHEGECTVGPRGRVARTDARGADRPARATSTRARGRAVARIPRSPHLALAQRGAAADASRVACLPLPGAHRRVATNGDSPGDDQPRRTRWSGRRGSSLFAPSTGPSRSAGRGSTRTRGTPGANVEAKYLQLRHAFETWGCRRVEWKTDAANERSRRALEALGSTFEGVHHKHMLVRDGENRDSAWYAVTDDAWPAVRAHLEARLAQKVRE